MLDPLAAQPGHLLWRASQRVAATLAEVLPPEVDVHAYGIVHTLADGGPSSQQSLSEAIVVSRTTLSTVAVDLARRGLVERVRNPDDLRSFTLTVTATGREALAEWGQHIDRLGRRVGADLVGSQRAELLELLVRALEPGLAPTTPAALRQSLGFAITRLHERMHRSFAYALAPVGIEPRHFGSLVALEATGPVPQSDLAAHLDVSGSRVVALVDDLEARDLLERRTGPGDRRTRLLHLRPGAADVLARARQVEVAVTEEVLSPLTSADRERLAHLLRRLLSKYRVG